MLSKRQNLLETIRGGHPDRYVNQYEAIALLFGTPYSVRTAMPTKGAPMLKTHGVSPFPSRKECRGLSRFTMRSILSARTSHTGEIM